MIKSLSVENFKCFASQRFDLGKVNIFAGYNGRGKSSAIQSLLLLAQSYQRYGNTEKLEINGEFVKLGLMDDLFYKGDENTSDRICFEIESYTKIYETVRLEYIKEGFERQGKLDGMKIRSNGEEKDYFDSAVSPLGGQNMNAEKKEVRKLSSTYPKDYLELFKNYQYISADRKGPVLYEEKQGLDNCNPIGKDGEHILNAIASGGDELKGNVCKAVRYIMDGGEISLDGSDSKSLVLSLNFMINSRQSFKAINCGYGYSYVLPIVVNALTMKDGALFIENPEAHLHPKAQSYLIRFLCKELCGKNVQIYVETHSEHVVNAVRLCTLMKEYNLTNKDVSIYFFDKDFSCQKLQMDEDAQISGWPAGFFDQQEIDLSEILKRGLFK